MLAPPPFDPELFRFNEGACDAAGRFWVGVMFDPLKAGVPARKASLHSFSLEGGLRPEADASELHNGMAWGSDGRSFYLTHSLKREIFTFSFDAEIGRISDRRVFARVPEPTAFPTAPPSMPGAAIGALCTEAVVCADIPQTERSIAISNCR